MKLKFNYVGHTLFCVESNFVPQIGARVDIPTDIYNRFSKDLKLERMDSSRHKIQLDDENIVRYKDAPEHIVDEIIGRITSSISGYGTVSSVRINYDTNECDVEFGATDGY